MSRAVFPRYGITVSPGVRIVAYTWDSDSLPDVSEISAILGAKAQHISIWDRVLQREISEKFSRESVLYTWRVSRRLRFEEGSYDPSLP